MNIILYSIFKHCERKAIFFLALYFPIYIQINADIIAAISLNGGKELQHFYIKFYSLAEKREIVENLLTFKIAVKYIAHSKWFEILKRLFLLNIQF